MSHRAYLGTRKGLFAVERSAGGWGVSGASLIGDNVSMLLPDRRTGAVYAALNHGHFGNKLHRSDDRGGTWREVGCPKYPERPADLPPQLDYFGREIPWSLKMIWALEPGADAGELWCGTLPGGLFRSADGGDTWAINRPLWDMAERQKWNGGGADWPGIHSISVDPSNPHTFYVAVSTGGVWKTRDNGLTWTIASKGMRAEYMPPELSYDPVAQDAHRIVLCPAAPNVLWCQHHNGIFRSIDGGENWTEITADRPGKSGFGVVVHPRDPDTAWFIPMEKDEKRYPMHGKLVVLKTTDGGKSFLHQTTGLPQSHCYDLVYRHCLDLHDDGETLIFGSTTGNVYVSENGGDSWTKLAEHLPPVYAVRWA
jgi:photosystem II stability/assembly factor-like uncharacterized protein